MKLENAELIAQGYQRPVSLVIEICLEEIVAERSVEHCQAFFAKSTCASRESVFLWRSRLVGFPATLKEDSKITRPFNTSPTKE